MDLRGRSDIRFLRNLRATGHTASHPAAVRAMAASVFEDVQESLTFSIERVSPAIPLADGGARMGHPQADSRIESYKRGSQVDRKAAPGRRQQLGAGRPSKPVSTGSIRTQGSAEVDRPSLDWVTLPLRSNVSTTY